MDNCCQLEVMFRESIFYSEGICGSGTTDLYLPVLTCTPFIPQCWAPPTSFTRSSPIISACMWGKWGGGNKEETLSFSLAISLFHQGCQLSPPAVPASYLSIISTWQIHFTMTSPSPYISFFLFFFLTSQLSSPLTGCLFLHKHEFAPLPTKMWFLKWILMVKKRQAWWREGKKSQKPQ